MALLFLIFSTGVAAAGDEVQINEQLKTGGAIHLASGVYNIESSIKIHSNTVLTGKPDTILRVSSSAGQWFVDGVGVIDNADTSVPLQKILIFKQNFTSTETTIKNRVFFRERADFSTSLTGSENHLSHYDFKHLTEKYFEIGMKLNDFSIQLVKYCSKENL